MSPSIPKYYLHHQLNILSTTNLKILNKYNNLLSILTYCIAGKYTRGYSKPCSKESRFYKKLIWLTLDIMNVKEILTIARVYPGSALFIFLFMSIISSTYYHFHRLSKPHCQKNIQSIWTFDLASFCSHNTNAESTHS